MVFKYFDVNQEYEKNKDLKKHDVEVLKDWLDKQAHLPKMPEQQIILFLHSCYYSSEAAKTAIDNFFTIRSHCPEFFDHRTKAILDESKAWMLAPLTPLTPDESIVVFGKLMNPDTHLWNFANFLKHLDMLAMCWLNNKGTNQGHVVVIDMAGSTLGHVVKINPMHMKKFLTYLQEGMPVRLKGLHFINAVSFMDKVLALMKPFMKKELMDLLHVHSDFETLYPFVPKHCLPKEYGGDTPCFNDMIDDITKFLKNNIEFFDEEAKQVVDESKREGKSNASELFGVEGTFKKLDID